MVENLGKRGTLQIVLLIVGVAVMIPHSVLYTRDDSSVAGKNTLLFKIVGPGESDYSIEEVSVDITAYTSEETRSWREGAVKSDNPSVYSGSTELEIDGELVAISAGGLAITKPFILPGIELPKPASEPIFSSGVRSGIITYEVKSGDSLGIIAEKFGISVATLLWTNNLTSRSVIKPGDQLKILPVSGLLHTVRSGETLLKIAGIYDAEITDIVSQNSLINNGASIRVGQDLIIPNGIMPVPVSNNTVATRKYTTFSEVTPPPSSGAPAGSGYLWPTSAKIITQYFGWQHYGLDIAGPVGTPLYATKAGTVIGAGLPNEWNLGYGGFVKIDHGGGVVSMYAHASQVFVSAGEKVAQGQTIAAMGSTGRSTGPHIHFEIRVNGVHQNPLQYIR